MGTKYYMAPEVANGVGGELRASLAIDVFSLGLMLCQLVNKTHIPVLKDIGSTDDESERLLNLALCDQSELQKYLTLYSYTSFQEHLYLMCQLNPQSRPPIHTSLELVLSQSSTMLQREFNNKVDGIANQMGVVAAQKDRIVNSENIEIKFNILELERKAMEKDAPKITGIR
jgi:serine/threonine protein kinase